MEKTFNSIEWILRALRYNVITREYLSIPLNGFGEPVVAGRGPPHAIPFNSIEWILRARTGIAGLLELVPTFNSIEWILNSPLADSTLALIALSIPLNGFFPDLLR